MYPVRGAPAENPSYMFSITLPTRAGINDSDYWVKRGTALLM